MKTTVSLCVACLIGSCMSDGNLSTVKGVLTDVDMHTVTLITEEKDTLCFSKYDAQCVAPQGLRLNDTLEVSYRGEYRKGMVADKMISHPEKLLLGGDRDEHGCLGSAGYTWCEVQKDCIRLFEKGVRMLATDGSGRLAFVVFAPDSMLVELFFSDGAPNEILQRRRLPSGEYTWNVEDDDTKNVRMVDGMWTISQRNHVIFKVEPDHLSAGLEGYN